MPFFRKPPLFNFAYHPQGTWLQRVAERAQPEPWGRDRKVLELYLRSNFELAKAQGKVYENRESGIAFFRAGHLMNITADPLWLVYERNNRDEPFWKLKDVQVGDVPVPGEDASRYSISYEPPAFDRSWSLYFYQDNLDHMLKQRRNKERLEHVFQGIFGSTGYNEHVVFRTVYAELELQRKQEAVLPQWYQSDYQFLMPLFLTQSDKVDLTAALRPEPALKRYSVRTLLFPTFAYAYARSVVKNRASFADWIMLSEEELESVVADEDEDTEQA
jgi:hypothetical protein